MYNIQRKMLENGSNQKQFNILNKSLEYHFESFNDLSYVECQFQFEQDSLNKFQLTIDPDEEKNEKFKQISNDIIVGEDQSQNSVEEIQKVGTKFKGLVKKKITWQSKNTIKYMMRLFLKYHKSYGFSCNDRQRIGEVVRMYRKLYKNVQGKINLLIYQYLFYESKYNMQNRMIFYRILGDREILSKQLYENGNVKKKIEYLSSIKFMRIRCVSRNLSSRTQDK